MPFNQQLRTGGHMIAIAIVLIVFLYATKVQAQSAPIYLPVVKQCSSYECTVEATTGSSTRWQQIDFTAALPYMGTSTAIGAHIAVKKRDVPYQVSTIDPNICYGMGITNVGGISSSTPYSVMAIQNIYNNGSYNGPTPPAPNAPNNCGDSGVYYRIYKWPSSPQTFFTPYYYDSVTDTVTSISLEDVDNPFPSFGLRQTKITNATVSGSTSTISVNVSYNIDTSEISDSFRPDIIRAFISTTDFSQLTAKNKLILPLVNGATSTTVILDDWTNGTLPDGQHAVTLWLARSLTPNPPNIDVYQSLFVNFTITGGIVTSSQLVSVQDAIFPTQPTQVACGLTDLSGCIVMAGLILLQPSEASVNKILTLNQNLSTKAPFIYAYQLSTIVDKLYNSPSLASSTITINILNGSLDLISVAQLQAVPYTAWLRTILGYIMWVLLAFFFYRRTLKVFNTNPQ